MSNRVKCTIILVVFSFIQITNVFFTQSVKGEEQSDSLCINSSLDDIDNLDLMQKTGITIGFESKAYSLGYGDDDYQIKSRTSEEVLNWSIILDQDIPSKLGDLVNLDEVNYLAGIQYAIDNGDGLVESTLSGEFLEYVEEYIVGNVAKLIGSLTAELNNIRKDIESSIGEWQEGREKIENIQQLDYETTKTVVKILQYGVESNYPNGEWNLHEGLGIWNFFSDDQKVMSIGAIGDEDLHFYDGASFKSLSELALATPPSISNMSDKSSLQLLAYDIYQVLKGGNTETKYGCYAKLLVNNYLTGDVYFNLFEQMGSGEAIIVGKAQEQAEIRIKINDHVIGEFKSQKDGSFSYKTTKPAPSDQVKAFTVDREGNEAPATIVDIYIKIPDLNLNKAIKEQTQKPINNNIITIRELQEYLYYDLRNKGIKDLTGLEYMTALKGLNLGNNKISDITPLRNLKNIGALDLSNNEIVDITPLKDIATHWLSLENNKIKDLSSFESQAYTMYLNVAGNQIQDLSPLLQASKNLKNNYSSFYDSFKWDIKGNPVDYRTDVVQKIKENVKVVIHDADFKDANLEKAVREAINKPDGIITNIDLQEVKSLSLQNKGIKDLTGLEYATTLDNLDLSNNEISDITPLKDKVVVNGINLANNKIKDISPLEQKLYISNLNLSGNQIQDMGPLLKVISNTISNYVPGYAVSDLNQRWDIKGNPVDYRTDVVQKIKENVKVVIHDAGFRDANLEKAVREYINKPDGIITNIDLQEVRYLSLENKGIKDLTGLEYMTSLNNLNLSNNEISDISLLKALSYIGDLDLSNNRIQNITPLENLSFNQLNLSGNRINNIASLISNLENNKIGTGTKINLSHNDLNIVGQSQALTEIQELLNKGILVSYEAQNDHIKPDRPKIDIVTNQTQLVTGTAEAEATVTVHAGSNTYTGIVKADGTYAIAIDGQKAGTVLTVTATDKAGNVSVPTSVTVQDKTAPVISGVNDLTVSTGSTFDPKTGVKATDEVDGDLTSKLQITGTANMKVPGVYTVVYKVNDKAKNVTTVTRKVTVVDKTAPVISGASDLTVSTGSIFDPKAGVKATDEVDGDLTGKLQITGTVNTKVPGVYTVVYKVSDKAKNVTTATRKITVADKTAPVISGASDFTVSTDSKFDPKAGVKATDSVDGDLTSKLQITGTVNTKVPGVYTVVYKVSDKAKNVTTVTRKITVVDKTAPVISGVSDFTVSTDSKFDPKAGVKATDNVDGDLTSKLQITGTVNTKVPGVYTVVYKVSDKAKNVNAVNRKVTVVDKTLPVISGASNLTVSKGSKFDPKAGVTATDNVDGDLTSKLQISGTVNTKVPGVYTVVYKVSDKAKNVSTVTRKITVVVDKTLPVIRGASNLTVSKGSKFDPKAGVTATDNVDGDLTSQLKITGTVNTKFPGIYQVVYKVSDKAGNTQTITRKIKVV